MIPWTLDDVEPIEGDPREVMEALSQVTLDYGNHTDLILHWLPTSHDGHPVAVLQPVTMHVHGMDCVRA